MNVDVKRYLIDGQSNDGVVHQSRLGKTDAFPSWPVDSSFYVLLLGIAFANLMCGRV
ncbi:MAG: hypothetical protein Q7T96_00670 [Methylobacter sp.]|nr:hypothetical protein [Methylobacter sp.]